MTWNTAVRSLLRTPAATLASIITLALAIGVNTAMFSVVYGVLMRPLPFGAPARLVQLTAVNEVDRRQTNFSLPELADWQARPQVFSAIALFAVTPVTMTGEGDAETLRGAVVSDRFFETLGVSAIRGRPLARDDARAPVAVLSERLWRRRYGGGVDAIGQTIALNGQPYAIAGVMADTFQFPADDVDVWTPLDYAAITAPPQWKMRGFRPFSLIGRLKPGITLPQAREDAAAVGRWLAHSYPRFNDRIGVEVDSLSSRLTARVRPVLLLLFGATGLVLLIASANLASLAVVRTAGRAREIAIRTAIGAGRLQLLRQFLTESALVAGAGSLVGLIIAAWTLSVVTRIAPAQLPRLSEVRTDIPVFLFTLATTAFVTLVCGTASGLLASRATPIDGLRDGRGISRQTTRRLHRGFVAAEVGLSMVLLVGASLLSRSLVSLMRTDSGVEHTNLLTLKANLASNAVTTPAQQMALLGRLIDAVARSAGVLSVGATSSLPPNVSQMHTSLSTSTRQASGQQDVSVDIVAASPHLFTTLGVPVLRGRSVDESDAADTRRVVVLSDAAAKRLFPDRDPVGQRLAVGPSDVRYGDPEVVGIVGDLKYSGLDAAPDGAVYLPYSQRPFGVMYLVVRTALEPDSMMPGVRRIIRTVDPSMAVSDVRSFDAVVADAVAQPRFRTFLLVALAALALGLAAVGIYGVIAHAAAERTAEIGIRMALGARRVDILALVMTEGLVLIVLGLVAGSVASVALRQLVAALLYGVEALDPWSYASAVFFIAAVGGAATAVPAWRATRVDPVAACRV